MASRLVGLQGVGVGRLLIYLHRLFEHGLAAQPLVCDLGIVDPFLIARNHRSARGQHGCEACGDGLVIIVGVAPVTGALAATNHIVYSAAAQMAPIEALIRSASMSSPRSLIQGDRDDRPDDDRTQKLRPEIKSRRVRLVRPAMGFNANIRRIYRCTTATCNASTSLTAPRGKGRPMSATGSMLPKKAENVDEQ